MIIIVARLFVDSGWLLHALMILLLRICIIVVSPEKVPVDCYLHYFAFTGHIIVRSFWAECCVFICIYLRTLSRRVSILRRRTKYRLSASNETMSNARRRWEPIATVLSFHTPWSFVRCTVLDATLRKRRNIPTAVLRTSSYNYTDTHLQNSTPSVVSTRLPLIHRCESRRRSCSSYRRCCRRRWSRGLRFLRSGAETSMRWSTRVGARLRWCPLRTSRPMPFMSSLNGQ